MLAWLSQYGYGGLFLLLILGIVGLPIPDETLLAFSGFLIASRRLSAPTTFGVALAGSICGISLSYLIGRTFGHALVLHYGERFGITQKRINNVHAWFARTGDWLLAFGYFIPGVRHFTALVAGMSELEYPRFAAFAYSGAAVWVSVFLVLGYFVGEQWRTAISLIHRYTWFSIGLIAVVALTVLFLRRARSRSAPGR
jgi:membrane protein DedA with SNARE-associated domain